MFIVLYNNASYLADNPIDRYAIGDRTPGLKYNEDGSLDIYLQHDSPGPDEESNWLPTPAGEFDFEARQSTGFFFKRRISVSSFGESYRITGKKILQSTTLESLAEPTFFLIQLFTI